MQEACRWNVESNDVIDAKLQKSKPKVVLELVNMLTLACNRKGICSVIIHSLFLIRN